MPSFTPAPWHHEAYRAQAPRFAVYAGAHLVAARIEREDDAQLIEAAPDLYEAASAACDWLHVISPTNPVTRQLEAALQHASPH